MACSCETKPTTGNSMPAFTVRDNCEVSVAYPIQAPAPCGPDCKLNAWNVDLGNGDAPKDLEADWSPEEYEEECLKAEDLIAIAMQKASGIASVCAPTIADVSILNSAIIDINALKMPTMPIKRIQMQSAGANRFKVPNDLNYAETITLGKDLLKDYGWEQLTYLPQHLWNGSDLMNIFTVMGRYIEVKNVTCKGQCDAACPTNNIYLTYYPKIRTVGSVDALMCIPDNVQSLIIQQMILSYYGIVQNNSEAIRAAQYQFNQIVKRLSEETRTVVTNSQNIVLWRNSSNLGY